MVRSINPALVSANLRFGLNSSLCNLNYIAVKFFASRDKRKSSRDLLDLLDIQDLPNCDCVLLRSAKRFVACQSGQHPGIHCRREGAVKHKVGLRSSHR